MPPLFNKPWDEGCNDPEDFCWDPEMSEDWPEGESDFEEDED